MTKQEFATLTSSLTLLDGATGSNLMAAGMPKGVCTEKWILDNKEIILRLQKAYAAAGSQIIYAPTFGGNRINLKKHGLEDHLIELNRELVALAREAAGNTAYVAGDITTTGEMLEPFGDLTYEDALETYKEQISCLAEAGVDLLVAETMFNVQEACAAIDAAQSICDLPIMCSMTVEADGSIFTGGNIIEAAAVLEGAGAAAVGINCSVGPDQLVSVVKNIRQTVNVPVIVKPNAGMPVINDDGLAEYHMTPEDFAKHMAVLIENGATIIGGCCGTTPAFITELAKLL